MPTPQILLLAAGLLLQWCSPAGGSAGGGGWSSGAGDAGSRISPFQHPAPPPLAGGGLRLRGGKAEVAARAGAGGGADEVSDPSVDSLDVELDALDLDGPRPEQDWSEFGTDPHPPAWEKFFDEDGDFDAEGYISHRKWPGHGERLAGDSWRLVSTRMEACDAGAEYGIFVDIEAVNRSVVVTGVKCASHALSNRALAYRRREAESFLQDPLDGLSDPFGLSTYVTLEGGSRGRETNRSAWRLLAHSEAVQLPRINGKEDWDAEYREKWVGETRLEGEWQRGDPAEPAYGSIPWSNVTIRAGEKRGFLIHGTLNVGIANRWPLHCVPRLGDVSDEDANIRLYASRAMAEEEAFTEEIKELPYEQCKEGLAEGLAEPVEPDYTRRRREGHAFVGEVLYTVL